MPETLERSSLGGARARRAREPRARAARRATGSAGTSCRATSTAPAPCARVREEGFSRVLEIERRARACAATWSRRARWRVDGVSLTVSALRDDGFAVSLIPETLERTNARRGSARATRQHRGRHPRQARRATAGGAGMSGSPHDDAVRDDRAGDRGHPPGQDGRRLRRRGPRERGRPDAGRAVRHARGDQLHGQGGARADLPVADPRALRRARPRPDGGQERVVLRNALHGLDRGARGRHHRDLRARPRAHDPGRDRPREPPPRPRPARPRVPAQEPRRRRARARRADRGGGRPRAPGGPEPGRRDLRGDERRRHDGARARTGRVLRPPRAEHDHGRRPDRLPPPPRQARRTRRRDAAADHLRRLRGGRLPLAGRRQAPRRARQGRGRRAARTCSCGCTRSASPATSSTRCAATAASSSNRRCR